MLALFREYDIAATWATVGFLFAQTRGELEELSPALRPAYRDPRLYPYGEPVGDSEADDPLHFARSLIRAILGTPRQELATHTFSHYYCLEPDQNAAAFAADLESAQKAAARFDVKLRSIVFPRNQHNPAFDSALRDAGIVAFRGNARGWPYRAVAGPAAVASRAARLLDCYVPATSATLPRWPDLMMPSGLCNVPATFFLRPFSPRLRHLDGLRRRRIVSAMRAAACNGRLLHLWWHPHNFGRFTEENLAFLTSILDEFTICRERHSMQSLAMIDVARLAGAPL